YNIDAARRAHMLLRTGFPRREIFHSDLVRPARLVLGPWDRQLSQAAGRPLRLVKLDQPGAGSDLAPVTLLSDASVRELERRSGLGAIDAQRFRMLINFSSQIPHVEDS